MRDGKFVQMPHSCHHVERIRHPNSSYVTTKLHGTSSCECNNNTIFSKRAILTFLTVDVCSARKAGFILRTQIYAVYADHCAHVGRVFSATNADLRRSDRADAEYKHSYNTPTFTLTFARLLKLC